jgi:hypothetical protein
MRKIALGSAASLAFAAATIAALPSFAQSSYPRQSTPVERARTQDLNRTATDGIVVRPTGSEQEEYEAAKSRYDEAQARYARELEEYNAKIGNYQSQRQDYQEELNTSAARDDAYADERTEYSNEVGAYAEATGPRPSFYDLWDIDRIPDPNTLFDAPVEDVDGFMTGHFRRLEVRGNGERMAVIMLNSRRTISIRADEVRYDPNRAVVVADWTSRDLDRLPPG